MPHTHLMKGVIFGLVAMATVPVYGLGCYSCEGSVDSCNASINAELCRPDQNACMTRVHAVADGIKAVKKCTDYDAAKSNVEGCEKGKVIDKCVYCCKDQEHCNNAEPFEYVSGKYYYITCYNCEGDAASCAWLVSHPPECVRGEISHKCLYCCRSGDRCNYNYFPYKQIPTESCDLHEMKCRKKQSFYAVQDHDEIGRRFRSRKCKSLWAC
ncbi:hypothetical protein CAPTEDRAFT_194905 [Capitella teleta]|uniref:UPAR/Ly6 domain-containing protein n=1 Tax=Capitella teleta TaxID=283909 RepID=R7U2M3_CAPTE|nr:hypothetical protein CAPTEDRAFT_194905 [Capitella teleta]|eukprot:ELT97415.1 hypothetical protein CAPTEDRAFT_194905 [Capitella teleta]